MRLAFVWLLMIGVALRSAVYAADWPCFGGPTRDFVSTETGINKNWTTRPPKELWRVAMSDDGFAGPAVVKGTLYILDHQDKNDVLRAIDTATGKDAWTYAYPNPVGANYGWSNSTPAIDAGRVHILSCVGLAQCLDIATRKVIWQKDLIQEFGGEIPQWRISMSPVIDGDRVIYAPGGPDATLVALNKATGAVIWKGGGSFNSSYATPVIGEINKSKVYVFLAAKEVVCVQASDGKLMWRFPWKTSYDVNAAMPLVFNDTVFITSGYNHGCALLKPVVGGAEPQVLWQNKGILAHFSTPVLRQGVIYGATDPAHLTALDAQSGKTLWKQSGFDKGGVVLIDGALIAMGKGAVALVALDSTACKELGRINVAAMGLKGELWTAAVVSDKKLYVRNRQTLVCFDLTPGAAQ